AVCGERTGVDHESPAVDVPFLLCQVCFCVVSVGQQHIDGHAHTPASWRSFKNFWYSSAPSMAWYASLISGSTWIRMRGHADWAAAASAAAWCSSSRAFRSRASRED